jgi:hypothetical protein
MNYRHVSPTRCFINPSIFAECSSRWVQIRGSWGAKAPRSIVQYVISPASLSAPPFHYESQARQLFALAVISCTASRGEATYEQTGWFFFLKEELPVCTARQLGAAAVLTNGCRRLGSSKSIRNILPGVKRPGRYIDHSPPGSAEVKNKWNYTSAPPVCLHGVGRDNFTLLRIFDPVLYSFILVH